jgi:hypothetical protein
MRSFGRLTTVLNNILALDEAKIQLLVWSDKDVQEYTIDLNRISQLFELGEDSKGNVLGEYGEYTSFVNEGRSFTFKGESKFKDAGDNYTLFDSGDFYRSFRMQPLPDGFVISANDIKEDGTELTRKFGIDILGLSIKSKHDLAQFILPIIIKEVRRQIFQ